MINLSNDIAQSAVQHLRRPDVEPGAVTHLRERQELAAAEPEPPAHRQGGRTEPSEQSISSAVVRLNEYLQSERRQLQFSVDEASGRTVITVTDAETDEVIRQIPPEELVAVMREISKLAEEALHQGILVREKV